MWNISRERRVVAGWIWCMLLKDKMCQEMFCFFGGVRTAWLAAVGFCWSLSTCIALKRGGVSVGGEGIPLSNQNRSAHLMHYHEEKKPRSEYMENSFSFLLEKAAIWTFLRCVLYIDRYLPLHEHRVRYLINSLVDWQLRLVHNTVLYVL